MLEIRSTGDNDPCSVQCNEEHWLFQNSAGMNYRFVIPGMGTAGWSREIACRADVRSELPDGKAFTWDAFYVDLVRLEQPLHLMLIEGASPLWVFMSARLEELRAPCTQYLGPFILLGMVAPPIHTAPYCLRDVVLGRLAEHIPDTKLVDLLPSMLSAISPSS